MDGIQAVWDLGRFGYADDLKPVHLMDVRATLRGRGPGRGQDKLHVSAARVAEAESRAQRKPRSNLLGYLPGRSSGGAEEDLEVSNDRQAPGLAESFSRTTGQGMSGWEGAIRYKHALRSEGTARARSLRCVRGF